MGVDMGVDHRRSWLRAALGLPDDQAPFPWQERLLARFIAGDLPSALDIPTGLGKTAVMAIWLVARACGAAVPRRLIYVVDRRAVVDQATAVAEQLRAWVEHDTAAKAALGLARPLPISTLRGQYVDNKAWLEDPAAPAIVLGTVDMIGSRLLFGGYGVSRKMQPYHAGLLGTDALIVLDEAHLVPPFERLVEQIASGVDANGKPLGVVEPSLKAVMPPLRFLSLSATGRPRDADRVFGLTAADEANPAVRRRLGAIKRVTLMDEVAAKELPEHLARHAWALSGEGAKALRIIVFCTSRDHAQKVQDELHKLAGKRQDIHVELFVGGRRVYEREEAARKLEALGFIAGSGKALDRAAFVIATAAGEVGVDLDADHAVCDLVAWERMVQRLGRVNRRGEGDAVVIVVPAASDDEKQQAQKARHMAVRQLIEALPPTNDAAFDASPAALTALKANPDLRVRIAAASTPPVLHPPLTRALVEAWSMTSLEEHAGRPEVAPWIRGWPDEEEEPQTTVVWRHYLPVTDGGELFGRRDLETFRDAADPHLSERLDTETRRVVDWLEERLKTLRPMTSDEEDLVRTERPLRDRDIVAVVLDPASGKDFLVRADGLASKRQRDDLGRALRGATLMVDQRLGGLAHGLLSDASEYEAERGAWDVSDIDGDSVSHAVPFRTRRITDADAASPPPGWRSEASIVLHRSEDGDAAWLLIESLIGEQAESEDARSAATCAQLLDEHQSWAEDAAQTLATALGLPEDLAEMLAASARLHDEGKQAECWQHAFGAPGGGKPPFAKTTHRPNIVLLNGYRHELGSLPYAEAHRRVNELAAMSRELCLHLIAAHHGNARPLIRTSGAPEPPSRLKQRAREIALRFTALTKVWGPWGLAWWEALLRAADQQASRRNDEQGGAHG